MRIRCFPGSIDKKERAMHKNVPLFPFKYDLFQTNYLFVWDNYLTGNGSVSCLLCLACWQFTSTFSFWWQFRQGNTSVVEIMPLVGIYGALTRHTGWYGLLTDSTKFTTNQYNAYIILYIAFWLLTYRFDKVYNKPL